MSVWAMQKSASKHAGNKGTFIVLYRERYLQCVRLHEISMNAAPSANENLTGFFSPPFENNPCRWEERGITIKNVLRFNWTIATLLNI